MQGMQKLRLVAAAFLCVISTQTLADARRISHSTLRLPNQQALFDGRAEVTGHALQGTTLRLLINDKPTHSVTTSRKTFWRLPVRIDHPGMHRLIIQQLQDNTVTWESTPRVVQAPEPPAIQFPEHGESYTGDYLQVSGVAMAHKDIDVLLNSQSVANTRSDEAGSWKALIAVGTADYHLQAEYPSSLIRPSKTVSVKIIRASLSGDPCQQKGLDLGTRYQLGPCESFKQVADRLAIPIDSLRRANADMRAREDEGHHNWLRLPPRRVGAVCGTEGYRDNDLYVVGRCDTVSYISRRYNYPIKSLGWYNPEIAKGNMLLQVGQLIRLPPR